jgi:hypothetical protein
MLSSYIIEYNPIVFIRLTIRFWGTRWRSCLWHCATNQKVAGLIPDEVAGIL